MLGLLVLLCLIFGAYKNIVYLKVAPSIPIPVETLNVKVRSNVRPGVPMAGAPVPLNLGGTKWTELSSSHKDALAPLANRWDLMSEVQKRQWLTLTSGFDSLSEDEQHKMLSRMTEWANLSAQQRSQARLNFAATSALSPDDKRAQWEAYLALSEEEKKRLAAKASRKTFGAAVAVKPSPKKLVKVPPPATPPPTLSNVPPVIDYHQPQPLPAPATPSAQPQPVETSPVQGASAVPQPLPPISGASASEPSAEEKSKRDDFSSNYSPS